MGNANYTAAEQAALHYIEQFKAGKSFTPPATGIVLNNEIDSGALHMLAEHLLSEDADTRENIVNLLADAAIRADTLYGKGVAVIRDLNVITAIARAGLTRPDLARERSAEVLRTNVETQNLKSTERFVLNALKLKPTDEVFLLAAKVKPEGAENLVEPLIQSAGADNNGALQILRAALGNKDSYMLFVNRLNTAKQAGDALAFAEVIDQLGKIGTSQSLHLVASELRTPLVIDKPNLYKKSARLDVLLALIYNFPGNPLLNPNNIRSAQDYLNAEKFCSHQFDVVYTAPQPPFLTFEGYPQMK